MSIVPHLERNLAQAEQLGQVDRAKKLKKRLNAELKPAEKPAEKKPSKKKGGSS